MTCELGSERPAVYVADGTGPVCNLCITGNINYSIAWSKAENFKKHMVLGNIEVMYHLTTFLRGEGYDDLCHPDCQQCEVAWFMRGWVCYGP